MTRVVSLARPGLPAPPAPGSTIAPSVDTRFLIQYAVANDQRFNSGAEGAYAGKRVLAALDESKRSVPLEQPDWELVRDSLANPMPCRGGDAYPVRPAHPLLPFIEDVRNAPEQTEKLVKGKRR